MREAAISLWVPKTNLGREVFDGKITSLDEIFRSGRKIKEPQIIDALMPNLSSEIIFIGGSPGKGGGIRRTPTKRTARMHRSGRRYNIIAFVVVGNGDGYLGVGTGESSEHSEAIKKATENAKLNIIPVKRGCGSWECACNEKHSIPFTVEGKKGSVKVILKPAPKGIGLCINDEAKKAMKLAGISDLWSKSFGNTGTRSNYIIALFSALKKMNRIKMPEADNETKEELKEAEETPEPAKEKKKRTRKKAKEEEPKEEIAEEAKKAENQQEEAVEAEVDEKEGE